MSPMLGPSGRLDRADPAVVGRMDVAHLEARALAGEATGPEGREAPLVRHRRERVRLVHELGELARAEELLDHGRHRLRVDEIVRHQRLDLLERHPLLDRTLHPHETDPVLVLEQLADDAHPAVAEVVDVVDALVRVGAVLQVDQVLHRAEDVLVAQRLERAEIRLDVVGCHRARLAGDPLLGVEAQLVVQLEPTDLREVVALRVEEQVVEEVRRRIEGRRIAGTQAPVDVDDRLFGRW